ncbi:MAG: prepilin peptidase [Pseudomonadota bacterium]
MNMVILEYGLLAGLATLLLIAAITDWRSRLINNWLTGTIAIAAPLYWWATGLVIWPDVAIQIGISVAVFAIFSGLFALGAMGGGDVKLLTALALWLPLLAMLKLLLVMSILGGVLTVVMLIVHKSQRALGKPEIPYGIAISLAGLWVMFERNFNHFG